MSANTNISCDGWNCFTNFDVDYPDEDIDSQVLEAGWHLDPETQDFHYCNSCWKQILEENPEWDDQ